MVTPIVSGTFDPITVGHLDIIERAYALWGNVVVAISKNTQKSNLLPDNIILESVKKSVAHIPSCRVRVCEGLLADFCSQYENPVIVRGARCGSDFDYERSLFLINKELGLPETVVLPAKSELDFVSSTYARELIKYGRPFENTVPKGGCEVIEEYLKK